MPTNEGDVLRVAIRWLYAGVAEQVNVWHLRVENEGPWSDAAVIDAIAEWQRDQYAFVLPSVWDGIVHSDTAIYNEVAAFALPSAPADTDMDGGSGTEPLPADDSALVTLRTSVPGRRGAKYLPTFVIGTLSMGRWTSGVMVALNAFGVHATAPWAEDGFPYLQAVIASPATSAYSDVTSYLVRNIPSHQDRRKIGVGS